MADDVLAMLPTLPSLKEMQDACLNEYGTSKNTKKAYKGHLSRGKKFLEEMVAQKRVSTWSIWKISKMGEWERLEPADMV